MNVGDHTLLHPPHPITYGPGATINYRNKLPQLIRSTPTDNYLSGTGKSHTFSGVSFYVPSEQQWIKYDKYCHMPRGARRDAVDMLSEDRFVDFIRNRDHPTGLMHKDMSLRKSGVPELRLSGYTRTLPDMPSRDVFQSPWPKADAWVPPARSDRGSYYGYYHETIELERERRDKFLPTSLRIQVQRDVPRMYYSQANHIWP